jgi:hypothetical protein
MVTEQFDNTALNNYMHRRIANGKMNGEKLKKASVNREIDMLNNLALIKIKSFIIIFSCYQFIFGN